MKKLVAILAVLLWMKGEGQPYNNEWIDYSKTYFKFKVGADGLYRIPQSVLANAGLSNTPAQYFQLFRNGQEVPIYPSVPAGLLGPSDYLEFWGHINDGKPDLPLYYSPSYQHTDKLSLETDTATYFLTVNLSTPVYHYVSTISDTTGNVLAPETDFQYTVGTYYKYMINPGFAQVVGEYIYSSSYDQGEFLSSYFVNQFTPLTDAQNNLFVSSAGGNAVLKFGAVGCADTLRHIQVRMNGNLLIDTPLNSFRDIQTSINFPSALITSGSATTQFVNNTSTTTFLDRMVVSFYELTYPRLYNFGGSANFSFSLPAKAQGYYLQITGFNSGSAQPVLYDQATGQRFVAVGTGGVFYFVLPGSLQARQLVMVSEDPSNIQIVGGLTTKNFINYGLPANQGNYLVISNPVLYKGTNGNNPIQDYKNYRQSLAGGSYQAIAVDITEITDQFAFGIKKHPLAIKNFINYARNNFSQKPQNVFLIGRGMTYADYRMNEGNPVADQLDLVPTFGYPASDNLLSTVDAVHTIPLTPIGRLGAINGAEVEAYLAKIKEYEQAQQSAPNTIAGRDWMKTVMHVAGATDPYLQTLLCGFMSYLQQLASDTLWGAQVLQFCSTNLDQNNQVSSALFPSLFSNGVSMLTYFGHSSVSDLGFNLDDPTVYNNQGKYPVFYVNGCYAGNYFTFDPSRLSQNKTISEAYMLAPERGSIAFVASSHFGVVNYLNVLLTQLYTNMVNKDYGKSIGLLQMDAAQGLINVLPGDYLARCHAEEMLIAGDPALRLNVFALPDYDVEASQVKISPAFISVANNSFTVNVRLENLGKAVNDSISVSITRKYPDGSSTTVKRRIPGIRYADSLQVIFPIIATRDKGQNTIIVTVNSDNDVPEITLANNSVSTSVFIYQDELTPIYPYNFAIINNATQKLYASTANPFATLTSYVVQIDTTEQFNSPRLVAKTINSVGGVLEVDPGFGYADSTVYYWRASIQPTNNGAYHWNEFSFIYLDSLRSGVGFNQSHYYQHLQSTGQDLSIGSDRIWHFGTHPNSLYIKDGVFPTAAKAATDFSIEVNGNTSEILSVCGISGIIYTVFDPVTFKPLLNGMPGTSRYGSDPVCGIERIYNFQFNLLNQTSRAAVVSFMDSIPDGSYVVVRNISGTDPATNTYAKDWQGDTSFLGSGNSMYLRLLNQGFQWIDSFYTPRAFIFTYQKNRQSTFKPQWVFSKGIYDQIFLSRGDYVTPNLSGQVTSPQFGPAKKWKQLHWRGYSQETPSTDSVSLTVYGVDTTGAQTALYNLTPATSDLDISAVNATQYPFLQLKLQAADSVYATPYQLKNWRLNYLPVPEGAMAPNLFVSMKDTVEFGEPLHFGIAFKNVSLMAFDSMKINMNITDKNNVSHPILLPKKRPLISGDTLQIAYDIDSKNYQGLNTIFVDVNPNNDQPEEYHFNNFLYHNFLVKVDQTNPVLDVTFDNVHILNEDIVSARPHILVKLTDEAKYFLLNDTSVLKVQLRYPDGSLHPYYFNNDTLRFTPATSSNNNAATVDFFPVFTNQINPNGDEYQLLVTGKDRSGNPAGTVQYSVTFKVITKAMISNFLNYPNPFTTSTAFVFTITGSEVPPNIKIQILTVTGKIVREITKEELGPLHIGRNITEFKWDGTDMFHQRLANGVYLYHVVTNLNGKSLDKYQSSGENTDQFFVKGYGKMYLMR